MKKIKKILIIIQRANGDVLLSHSLINSLNNYYVAPEIDLLVNDDTLALARLLPNINLIHTFSYKKKRDERWMQEKKLFKKIYRRYDLSINLTASDRSVIYALIAGNIVDSIVIVIEIKNTNNTSWYLISEGNVDKK